MSLKPKIIYNPAAGKGTRKDSPHVEALLTSAVLTTNLVLTNCPGTRSNWGRRPAEGRYCMAAAATARSTRHQGAMQSGGGADDRRRWCAAGGEAARFLLGMGIPHAIQQACDLLSHG